MEHTERVEMDNQPDDADVRADGSTPGAAKRTPPGDC